jgi:hypothetical protein
MPYINKKILGLSLVLLIAAPLFGQIPVVKWIDRIDLTVPDMRVVFLSDITNFVEVQNMPVFFTADGEVRLPDDIDVDNTNFVMTFKLFYEDGPLPVIVQSSKRFTLPGIGLQEGDALSFTNLIFINGRLSPGQTGAPLEWGSATINEQEGFSYNDLGQAQLPNGAYLLTVGIAVESNADFEVEDASTVLTITGIPSFLELIYPGAEYGDANVPKIFQELPVFQWRADNAEAFSKYTIRGWLKQDYHRSVEEVVQSEVVFEETLDYTGLPLNDPRKRLASLPYTQITRSQPLQIGATYVWSVEGTVASSSGPDVVKVQSPYFIFTLAEASGEAGASFGEIENTLRRLLGNEIPENIQRDLKGVRFNGTIRINGREVSPLDLARLVTQLETAAQKDEVNITEYVKDSRVVE